MQANFGTKVSCPGLRTLRWADFKSRCPFDRVPSKDMREPIETNEKATFQFQFDKSGAYPVLANPRGILLVLRGLALPFAPFSVVKRVAGR